MSIIIGFGKTETDNQIDETKQLAESIKGIKRKVSYFEEEYINRVQEILDIRCNELEKLYKEYKTSREYPQRYYSLSARVNAYSVVEIYIGLKFTHINRQHPFSLDGWGAWFPESYILRVQNYEDELKFTLYDEPKEIQGGIK